MSASIHHIELYVSNLEVSRKFYSWLLEKLGYQLYQDWKEGFSFKLDDTYIVFVQVEDEFLKYGYHRKRIGLNHLAFRVQDRKAVDEINQLLDQYNISKLYNDQYPYAGGKGHYAVYFEDPDRIKLEIVSEI
nr:VOC family protein [Mammaliicoccus sp. Marseille-Q6498]